MKRIALLLIVPAALLLGCETQNSELTSKYVPVILVNQICRSAIFEIQDSAYNNYGENIDGYENVFFGRLECPLSEFGNREDIAIPEGKLLYAELDPKDFKPGCAICQAIINYTGKKHYNVRIQTITSETGQ